MYKRQPSDTYRISSSLRKIEEWYVGDGWYSDGPRFAFDYYNSFVIHPMYIEALEIITEAGKREKIGNMPGCNFHEAIRRAQRFGVILERLISPEGTLPVFGRSITYRTGSLQTCLLYTSDAADVESRGLGDVYKRQLCRH